MLTEFIERQLKKAHYKLLRDGTYFGEIPSAKGVWASAKNLEDCRVNLREVFEDWLVLKLRNKERVPGFEIGIHKVLEHA